MLLGCSSCRRTTDYTMPQYGVPEKLTGHTRRAVTAAQHTDAFPRRKLLIGGLNNGQLLPVFQFNRNFKAIVLGLRQR